MLFKNKNKKPPNFKKETNNLWICSFLQVNQVSKEINSLSNWYKEKYAISKLLMILALPNINQLSHNLNHTKANLMVIPIIWKLKVHRLIDNQVVHL